MFFVDGRNLKLEKRSFFQFIFLQQRAWNKLRLKRFRFYTEYFALQQALIPVSRLDSLEKAGNVIPNFEAHA